MLNSSRRRGALIMLLALTGCASEPDPDEPTTPVDTTGSSTVEPNPSSPGPVSPTGAVSPDDSSQVSPTTSVSPGPDPSETDNVAPEPTQPEPTQTVSPDPSTPDPMVSVAPVQPDPTTGTDASDTDLPDAGSGVTDGSDSTATTDDGTGQMTTGPGSDLPPNPSGWAEPGEGGMAQPNGTAGNLEVLDWAGFAGAVSYSFDDCNSSQINNFQAMMDLDVPLTFYMWTGKSEASNPVWAQALEAGHELGNHTQSHQSGGNAADTDLATQFLQNNLGTTPYTMAAPNGDSAFAAVADGRFLINRGVSGSQIAPNSNANPFNLGSYVTGNSNAVTWNANNFNMLVDQARSGGTWHILTLHGFAGGNDGAYGPVNLDDFVDAVNYAKSFGDVWIDTVEDIGAYWLGQKAFNAATPQAAGDGQTWSWTLPDNFPPNKHLRVIVDGGTLTQDGEVLAWNEHGFYEIALDVGSLTLAP